MPGTSLSAVRPALQTPAELLAAGRPADAAEALAAVVADAPTYAAAYVLLGVALDAAGRPAEALAAWHRAAFLVPRSPLVLRERQRLIDATRAAEPPAHHDDPLAPAQEAPGADPPPLDVEPATHAAGSETPSAEPSGPLAGPPSPEDDSLDLAGDLLTIQTAPLDDFIFADSPPADGPDGFDPDGFDPEGFDFAAFDLEDDGENWLSPNSLPVTEPGISTDTTAAGGTGGDLPPPAPDVASDWAEWPEPDTARLVLPDDTGSQAPAPHEAAGTDEAWAVFEDLPAAPPGADTQRLGKAAPDDWFADPAFAAPTPLFHEAGPDEDSEPDGALDDEVPIGAEPDEHVRDEPDAKAAGDEPVGATPSAARFAEPAGGTVADELDLLIASLESAPRIRPDPTFAGPAVHAPEADTGEMASETLARIYAAQHQYARAALVYETLAAREPTRAEEFLRQAAEMRTRRP